MPNLIFNLCRGRCGLLTRCTCVLVLATLSACATHRNDPPQCKGPFTPINQTSSVASNGPQR
jgi:hypothetical protein